MASHTVKNKIIIAVGVSIMLALAVFSLFVGKYPLTVQGLMDGNPMQWKVFRMLRLSRMLVGLFGGFALGVCGYVFQTIFKNPLASPDVIGISSGASAGAAFGILFLPVGLVTLSSFVGALLAMGCALILSAIDKTGKKYTIVLAGIAVHALFQTALMYLKLVADPERELASIEYWIMGSLSAISSTKIKSAIIIIFIGVAILFLLYRQIVMLSMGEGEIKLLGLKVTQVRIVILVVATLVVAAVISLTGLISFIGLIPPAIARLLLKDSKRSTMFFSGIVGAIVLVGADILARRVAASELPVSIFTSLIGAPVLIALVVGRKARG